MEKALLILLIILLLIPTMAYAEGQNKLRTLTKEYEFETTNHVFEYEPPDKVNEDGVVYILKTIEYEELDREDLFIEFSETITREVLKENIIKKDSTLFDETISVDDAEFKGEMTLKEITYTDSLIDNRKTSYTQKYNYGTQVEKPKPTSTLEVLYHDKETDTDVLTTLDFKKLEENNEHWTDNIHVEEVYRSIYKDEYLLNDGTRLSFLSEKPEYTGIENSILTQMRLEASAYKIIDSKWINKAKTDSGQTMRTAEYIVKRKVKAYAAIYSGTFKLPNILTYDAHAIYEAEKTTKEPNGRSYTVNAMATYEEKPVKQKNNPLPVIAGTTGGVVCLCGLIVFLIKKRKKDIDDFE